jgi:purine-binding chemotaxis protein CheW
LLAGSIFLWVTSGDLHCGLPLEQVLEVCRPLPVQALGTAPDFVSGLARLRGEAVPVVDLGRLLGRGHADGPGRLVRLKAGDRRVALAVDRVLGLRELPTSSAEALPPLFNQGLPAVEALGALDRSLYLLLSAARLLPPEGFAT